jgi:hypothetical protein
MNRSSRTRVANRPSTALARIASRELPNPASLEAIAYRLGAASQVRGWFVGFKRKNGRRTRQLALICCVDRKIPVREIPSSERLPRTVTWREGRKVRVRVPIDVQEIGASGLQADFAGPADIVGASNGRATAGVAVSIPSLGPLLTTAAHAVIQRPANITFPNAPRFTLTNATAPGTVQVSALSALWDDEADFALLRVLSGQPTNLFADQFRIKTPFFPLSSDVGRQVFALTSRGAISMRYEGPAPLMPVGGFNVRGGLLATAIPPGAGTQGGDSGCCLVDDQLRLWGLLMGFVTIGGRLHSIFQSPAPLLRTGAQLL